MNFEFSNEELKLIQNVLLNLKDNTLIKDTDLLLLIGKVTRKLNISNINDSRNNLHYIYVKYEDENNRGVFTGKSYSYYTNLDLNVGDLVEAPTKFGTSIARVSEINVPEESVKDIIPLMKEINRKIDKKRFLDFAEVLDEAS